MASRYEQVEDDRRHITAISKHDSDDDNDSDLNHYDEDLKFKKTEKIKGIVIFVFALVVAVIITIIIVVTITRKDEKVQAYLSEQDNATVNLTCMFAHGVIEDGTYVFKGLPYAVAPDGELRWHPPESWATSDECSSDADLFGQEFRPQCPQLNPATNKVEGSEDCLYLNVWTSQLGARANMDVLVYIHGGGFISGSGNTPGKMPDNTLLRARSGIVYVTLNYRLGGLGFLSLEGLSSDFQLTGNYGLMDQVLALKWVKENIAGFGGNPESVTVFGEGAGATSILALLASQEATGLFHHAWLLSPSSNILAPTPHLIAQRKRFISDVKCRMGPSEMLRCLRGRDPEDIVMASSWSNPELRQFPRLSEGPYLYLPVVDGHFLKRSPQDAFRSGVFNDVPVLIGTTSQETDDVPVPDQLHRKNITQLLEYLQSTVVKNDQTMAGIQRLYKSQTSAECLYTSIVTDIRVTCPVNHLARQMQQNFTSPVYRYIVSHMPHFPVGNNTGCKNCVFHGLDLLAFFESYSNFTGSSYGTQTDRTFVNHFYSFVQDFFHMGKAGMDGEYPKRMAVIDQDPSIVDALNDTVCQFWKQQGYVPKYANIN